MIDRIATGFTFTEGPVWRGSDLLFSDIPNNRTVRYRILGEGPEVTTFRTPSGNANGLTLDHQGRLLACEHSGRRVSRVNADGSVETMADNYEGKRLSSPNDIVVRSDGSIFFTDPPYGLKNQSEGRETPCNGVFRLDSAGRLHLLVDDFERPNGLAFSPDETTLYIDDSAKAHIRAFDVAVDGSLSNGRVWAELKGAAGERGVPDGMKVDSEGNVYCTGAGGIWVFAANGRHLGRIHMPEVTANLAWGDSDWKSLYLTATTSVYRLRMNVAGVPVGPSARR
ncbi:MAG: SMP-30/gluconolactonase/LRE family protein [Chloroflexota bacterium]|nr:MAG: SMP-30/gluconolactonase/LRE family protein [Chloroflexota bacterium]